MNDRPRPLVERILAGELDPYIADADGAVAARRTAGILRDELATLPTGPDQPGYYNPARRATLEAQAEAWDQRATMLEDLAR